MKATIILYYYRGIVERGRNYKPHRGYSAKGPNGGVLYPWLTKAECKRDAAAQGATAIFVEAFDP